MAGIRIGVRTYLPQAGAVHTVPTRGECEDLQGKEPGGVRKAVLKEQVRTFGGFGCTYIRAPPQLIDGTPSRAQPTPNFFPIWKTPGRQRSEKNSEEFTPSPLTHQQILAFPGPIATTQSATNPAQTCSRTALQPPTPPDPLLATSSPILAPVASRVLNLSQAALLCSVHPSAL